LVLTERLEFVAERDSEIFAAIPDTSAVFLLLGDDPQSEPYVSKTANLRRRIQRLLGNPTHGSRRLTLRDRVRWIEFTSTGSDFESGFLLYKLLRSAFPTTYGNRLRLRFAPLIRIHLENQFPRASVTTKISRNGRSLYYGPFPSRSFAEKFASDSLDLFKMRRCVEDLNPDPAFPGCIYSEMKMCLAPCFKGCTDEEYRTEVGRVQNLFDTNGEATLRELSAERDQASTNLDFEKAAAFHVRIEKLKPILSQVPAIVHRIDHLWGVIVQPSALPNCVALFRIDAGEILGPKPLAIQPADHTKSQSMEGRVQEVLGTVQTDHSKSAVEVMEHLAILKRWFYRSNRTGEVFFADDKGSLPMRRIVRGIARVHRGEKPEPDAAMIGPVSDASMSPRFLQ
jgi:excinuclease UvrABC nuclease subunit